MFGWLVSFTLGGLRYPILVVRGRAVASREAALPWRAAVPGNDQAADERRTEPGRTADGGAPLA